MKYYNFYVVFIVTCLALAGTLFWWANKYSKRGYLLNIGFRSRLFKNKAGTWEELLLERYELFKNMFFLFLTCFLLISGAKKITLLLLITGFLLSSHKVNFLNWKLPYQRVLEFILIKRKESMNKEIVRAMSQLKNLAVMKQDDPPGVMFVLNQLQKFTRVIKPIFEKMVALYSQGRRDEACLYFEKEVGTKEARSFVAILKELEQLMPAELIDQIVYFQEVIRRERETNILKKSEARSNYLFAFVFGAALVVMINFIVVVFYIETMESLKLL